MNIPTVIQERRATEREERKERNAPWDFIEKTIAGLLLGVAFGSVAALIAGAAFFVGWSPK